ncbi:MAG: alpha/beta fold hydrolase [Solirubrobacteraceae bacterium]
MNTVTSPDGVTIAYERSGSGPALVIVNGALSTKETGAPLAPLLDGDFTLYRYDRRGRGDSSDAAASMPQDELRDLAALAAATGEAPFVFGQSSGAALSLEAAASGVPVRGLVVHEPPYVPGDATSAQTVSELAALAADGRRDEAVERFMQGSGMPEAMIEQMKVSPAWAGLLALAHTIVYDLRLLNEGVVPAERFGAIDCRVLGTAGSLSPPWAAASVRAIAEAVPDGEWREVEGQSHNMAPDVLAGLLRERFL